MTRIIAGRAGATRIDVPKSGTRPTSDRVREAMFSTLESWEMLDDAFVVDLYAGSGALGLESASRGARRVVLIEKHPPAAQIIERNAQRVRQVLGGSCEITVLRQSARSFLEQQLDREGQPDDARWDVVFVDPPYDHPDTSLADNLALVLPHLAPGAVVMVERSTRSGRPPLPDGYTLIREKKYGETTLWWVETAE